MNNFDFSLYDPEDNSTYISKKKSKPKEKSEFDFDLYEIPEKEEKSYLDTAKDYGKTILKGAVEGLGRLGQMMSGHVKMPEINDLGEIIPPETKEQERERQTKSLDELLPTDEGFIQKGIRRGLRELPSMSSFPGSTAGIIPRTAIAGFAGQTAEELGLPAWAQVAAELTAYIGPDLTKKLLSKGKNSELIEFAKEMGMTDAEITPLIQSDFKKKWLSGLAIKTGETETALSNTKNKLDSVYGTIQKSEPAAIEISEKANGDLINGIYEKLNDMPREIREKIEKDLSDLLNNKITGKSLINFWKDINSNGGPNKKQISLLKEPVKKALKSISPELSKDFEMVNNLYTKYFDISSKLKPGKLDAMMKLAEYVGGFTAFSGAFFGNFTPLVGLVGEKAARKFSQQLLINPRYQQMSQRMVEALNNNKFGVAKKIVDSFSAQIKEEYPEIAKELKSLTEKELKEFLS